MAEFHWKADNGTGCPFCGTAVSERGFVDCIGDTLVQDAMGNVTGFVDVVPCATCIEQAARLVGSATQAETLEMAQMVIDRDNELEKVKDEVSSWQSRFNNLVNALSEGIKLDLDNPDLAVRDAVSGKPIPATAVKSKKR